MTRYKFTYASPEDGPFKRLMINFVEIISGRNFLQKMYDGLYERPYEPTPWNVWETCLDQLNIGIDWDEEKLKQIPESGPIIFVANHPYGVVDGAILMHLVTQRRKDFFLLINEVLSDEPILKAHLLPVDFRGTPAAKQTNLNTQRATIERLNAGEVLVIFPGGGVATAPKVFDEVKEFPWRRFISPRIHATKCSVIPIFFHGRNSRLFQLVSKFSMNLRLGLLLYEVMNKRNKTIKVTIGDPIHYPEMEPYQDKQELIDFLYQKTMTLGGREP